MKIDIENLKAQMTGRELNIYQKADALIEFNKLLDYVNELEQLTIPVVSKNKCNHKWRVPLMYNENNQNNPTDCVKCGEMIRDISMF